eukprot:c4707_g1_i1 orf=219-425(+)
MRSTKVIVGDLCASKEVKISNVKGIHCSLPQGEPKELAAEALTQSFQEEVALVTLLKNCAKQKDLCKG